MIIEYVLVNDEGVAVVQVPLNSSVAKIEQAIRTQLSSGDGYEAHRIVLERFPNNPSRYIVLIDQGLQSFLRNGCTVDVVDGQPLTDAHKAQVQKDIRDWIIEYQIRELDLTEFYVYFGITWVMECAFAHCDSLTSIILPDGIDTISNYAFAYCTSLNSIHLPNCLTTIGQHAFAYCKSLHTVDMPNCLTTIGYCAFTFCRKLVTITFPDSVTEIHARAFMGCPLLNQLSISTRGILKGEADVFDYVVDVTCADDGTTLTPSTW